MLRGGGSSEGVGRGCRPLTRASYRGHATGCLRPVHHCRGRGWRSLSGHTTTTCSAAATTGGGRCRSLVLPRLHSCREECDGLQQQLAVGQRLHLQVVQVLLPHIQQHCPRHFVLREGADVLGQAQRRQPVPHISRGPQVGLGRLQATGHSASC